MTIITVAVGLFIFGFFLVVTLNIQSWFQRVGRKIYIEAYLTENLEPSVRESLIAELTSKEEVAEVKYITPDEAKQEFSKEFSGELLQELDINPFPPSLRIKLHPRFREPRLMQKFAQSLKQNEYIYDLDLASRLAESLFTTLKTFWLLVILGGIVLFVGAFLIIFNTVRLGIYNRSDFIYIMRIVGATQRFIARPFIYEGILHGLCAGVLAGVVLWGLFILLSRFFTGFVLPYRYVSIILVPLGAILGGISSKVALYRYTPKIVAR